MSLPIAIVGMSCQFPGVTNLEEFWATLTKSKTHLKSIYNSNYYGAFSDKNDLRQVPIESCQKMISETLTHAGYTNKKNFSLIIGNLLAPTTLQNQFFS